MSSNKIPNRLANEKSPYLLQHAYNPVDWYPWGMEAFEKARNEDKPIFLSVGYSTCYWCHVMEREVFENDSIAALMNDALICIKVDREERPDVDRIYMAAIQAMTNSGGWPMSVFLTPDLKPFFGGTYFPPTSQYGRPGFPQIIERVSELWKSQREKIIDSSEQITTYLAGKKPTSDDSELTVSILSETFHRFKQVFDPIYAGFGNAPKFPRPPVFNFLLRYYHRTGDESALTMTLKTLHHIAKGGMYDHIGGGFHRYSVDGQWRIPHFEKMLYDQAQLVCSYVEAYQITHDEFYSDVVRDALEYVLRNLQHPQGGFYSAEDAESAFTHEEPHEKEEGVFYLWTASEVHGILGEHAPIYCFHYGIEEHGNALHDPLGVFQGNNILYTRFPLDETAKQFHTSIPEIETILSECKKKLFEAREKRPRPHLDDKIITSWNGLMISAFAKASQALGNQSYLEAATKAARFITANLITKDDNRVLRRYRDGEARFEGSLQDYAFLTQGLLDLYETSFDVQWLEWAITLTQKQILLFTDETIGGFYDTTGSDPSLLVRMKEDYDGAEPTGNSIAAINLLRLALFTDNKEWHTIAEKTVGSFGLYLQRQPEILPQMLVAFDWLHSSPNEIMITVPPDSPHPALFLKEIYSRFLPNKIVLLTDDGGIQQDALAQYLPFIKSIHTIEKKTTGYVCKNFACQLPTTDPSTFALQLTSVTTQQG